MISTLLLKEKTAKLLQRLGQLHIVDLAQLSSAANTEEELKKAVLHECQNENPDTQNRLLLEFFGHGPLQKLYEDTNVSEILVNGSTHIWFELAGKLQSHSDCFLSETTYRNFIWRVCREANIQFSLNQPFADGSWNGFRVHLASHPVSHHSIVLSLRRHPHNPWTLQKLTELGWANASQAEALRTLLKARENFLIIGGTGTGKTSVLNACLQELPTQERVVIVEDTDELKLPNAASTKLLTRYDPHHILRDISQTELVRQSLRMRPDRIVMGEIRGAEAQDLLMAFATGHSGCMGTLHAESARQALIRLEMLIQMGKAQWNLHAVRTLILLSLKAIVVVQRTADGSRRLEGIYKISSLEDCGFLLEPVS